MICKAIFEVFNISADGRTNEGGPIGSLAISEMSQVMKMEGYSGNVATGYSWTFSDVNNVITGEGFGEVSVDDPNAFIIKDPKDGDMTLKDFNFISSYDTGTMFFIMQNKTGKNVCVVRYLGQNVYANFMPKFKGNVARWGFNAFGIIA
jgi:hypothetical protein